MKQCSTGQEMKPKTAKKMHHMWCTCGSFEIFGKRHSISDCKVFGPIDIESLWKLNTQNQNDSLEYFAYNKKLLLINAIWYKIDQTWNIVYGLTTFKIL